MLSLRHPPNMLSLLSNASFSEKIIDKNLNGISKCNSNRCKICTLYLDASETFITSNGTKWQLKSRFTCAMNNVIYFLTCNFCKTETYIGKTVGDKLQNRGFKVRMNGHISECRTGISSCKFPKHVFNCGLRNINDVNAFEPFFKINIMLVMKSPEKLELYEKHFHKERHDTMNRK